MKKYFSKTLAFATSASLIFIVTSILLATISVPAKAGPAVIQLNTEGKVVPPTIIVPEVLEVAPLEIPVTKVYGTTHARTWGFFDPLKNVPITVAIGKVVKQIMPLVGSLFFVMFVYGGFLWFIAGGDTKRVDKSKKTLTYAVLGLAIIMGAYAILDIVLKTFGSVIQ